MLGIIWLSIFLSNIFKFVVSTTTGSSAQIQPIFTKNINTEYGETTYYQFKFNYNDNISDGNANIMVVFPEQVGLNQFPPYLDCYFKVDITQHDSVPCDYNIQRQVILKVGNIVAGEQSIAIGPIQNPYNTPGTSFFKVCIMYNDYTTVCNDNFGKVFFERKPASMISADVQQKSSLSVNQGSSWHFDLTLKGIYEISLFSVRVIFPEGFKTKSASCEVEGSVTKIETVILYNQRMIECNSIGKSLSGSQSIRIVNMINPKSLVEMKDFQLELLQESNGLVFERITFNPKVAIILQSGALSAKLVQENNFKLSNSTLSFYINPSTLLGEGGAVQIKFGSEWTLWAQNCTIVKGFERYVGINPTCYLNSLSNSYYLDSFKDISFTEQIIITILAQSPPTEGTFPVTVQTLNSKSQTVDFVTLNALTNSTFGSLNRFTAHAVRDAIKLKAGKAGPLESTFFLKHKLPPTNYKSTGKVVIDIFPQIPKPSSNYGIIKCYFFGNVLASNCDYDSSTYVDRTKITIYTPENFDYQESEIPITVTTEGSKPGYNDGIPLDPLVKRYLFHYHFYDNNVATSEPTEVYYQEWIPDAFEIPDTDFKYNILIRERNEYTHMRFEMKQQISLPYSDRNYLYRVTFVKDSSNVWEIGQSYDNDYEIIEDYPCWLFGTGVVSTPFSKCDLYQQSYRDPFVQAYNFETLKVLQGTWVIMEVPQIKIRNVPVGTKGTLRFSLMEETPGMINPQVELYYKDISVEILAQSYSTYSFNPNIATTLIPPQVNSPTDLRFQWTAAIFDPQYIIYEIDQVGYYDVGRGIIPTTNCDGNQCIKFKKPIQWIVIYPASQLNQNIINNIKGVIQNANYQDTFVFKVRLMRNGSIVNKHTFNVRVEAAEVPSKIFDICNTNHVQNSINSLIRKNEEQEYYIKFTTKTYMPRNSLIRFTFKNILTQVQTDRHYNFCKIVSGLAPFDKTPVQCKTVNTKTIELTHFEEVQANTPIEIHFRLLNDGAATITPIADIETFFGPLNTKLIDIAYQFPINTPSISTNNVDSQIKFKVLEEAVRSEKREKGYIGPVILDFTPNVITVLKKITVKFDVNFVTPRNYGVDSLICLVNEVRFNCAYTTAPLTVTVDITTNTLVTSTIYRLSISTEYVSPLDGIVHPKTEGFYPIHVELQDNNGVINQATRWMFVKADKFQFLYIESVIRNAGRANMFYINFKTALAVQRHSLGGRIQIEFPTVDPVGNPLFDLDLGGYSQSGDNVGCRFIKAGVVSGDIGDINVNRCRLIKSQRRGNPAIVEIINFLALPAGTEIQMWIAKVFNPPNFNNPLQTSPYVMDANIAVNIYEQNVSTGALKYIHYDTYNVFMDIRDDPALHDAIHPFSAQTLNQVWEAGSKISSTIKSMVNQVWYDASPFTTGDYYIVELPNTSPDVLQPDWKMATCSTFYDWCLTFPQINWVVMHINTNLAANTMFASNDVYIQLLPLSVPQITTTYKAYVWQGRFFRGYVTHQITAQQWMQLVGTIKNVALLQIDSAQKLIKGRKRVEVSFNFTTTNFIPYYGAIQIRFPSRIPSIQSHCRSAITVSSALTAKVGSYGNIGCLVQDTNTWVIYGFKDLNALSNVKITGTIDMPKDGVAGYIGDLDVITYGSHEYDNIFNVGRLIDNSLAIPNSGFKIDNFDSKQLEDIDLLHIETKTLRNAYKTPLTFKFKVGANIIANKGRIRMMFYQYSQLSFNDNRGTSFQYVSTSQYVCNIQVALTQENYGCKIELISLKNQGYNQIYYLFQMIPNSDLVSNVDYLFTLTTIDGNGQDEGLTFPNSGLPYKIDVSMAATQPSSDSDYTLHEHLYYQVYGTPFSYLKFTSYITLKTEMNLFIIEFTPGQIIRNDDTLIIEIPTASIDIQYYLFADDGGLNLQNQDIVPNDIIDMSATYPNPTMECRISRGLQIKGLPLKFMCSNFKSNGVLTDIGATDTMKVAFNIQNPDVTANHYSIPAQVYVNRNYQNANEKILYDFVENAFYIHFWSPQIVTGVNGDFNLGPVTTTVCNINTDFKFRVRNTQNLIQKNDDAYILRFNYELRDDDYLHKKNCAYVVTGSTPHDCAVLPNLRSMIVWPNPTNDLVAPVQVQTTGNRWWTNNYRTHIDNQRYIVGYASYVRELWSEKIIYQDLYPDIQPQRVNTVYFDLRFKNANYNYANERMDFIFQVTAPYWYYMDRVIILVPANIGWQIVGDMCLESPNSDIEITKCWFVNNAGAIEVWIDVAHKETYVKGDVNNLQTLLIESHMEVFQVPVGTSNLNPLFSSFGVKFYTWSLLPSMQPVPWRTVPPTVLTPASEKYTCFTDSGVMRPGEQFGVGASQAWDDTWKSESTIEFDYEYHRYLDEFVPCFKTDRSPIRMDIYTPVAFSSLKGTSDYHIFDFFYGDDVVIPTPVEIKDYVQDKLICWVNNDRVKCENDSVNKKIRLYFQCSIALNGIMFVFITSHDTNDITKEGFSYQGTSGQYKWLYEMTSFGSAQTYYGYTDPFPIMYNTQNGAIKCPHRGIEDGDLAERSTQISGKVTGYWFWYRFARPDILGITVNFKPRDYDMRDLYPSSFFMNLESGSQYPCSRGLSGGKRNDVRCIYEKGDNTGFGIPHRIHIFDFNYQVGSREIFGLLFQSVSSVFKITVEAWGGIATYNQPYGNYFMGSLIFDAWWGPYDGYCNPVSACSNLYCDNTQNACNYVNSANMVPEKSAFMDNNILHFMNFCQATTQTNVMIEVTLQMKNSWDSSYVEMCTVDPRFHVKDMFIYEKYTWPNQYVKKAYLYYDFSAGPENVVRIGYIKCKHYRQPIIAYFQCGDLKHTGMGILMRFETITHTICEDRVGSAACQAGTANTNEYFADINTIAIDNFNNDYDMKVWHWGLPNWLVLAFRLFDVHNYAFTTPYFDSVLTIAYHYLMNYPSFGLPFECYVVEGLRMSDRRKLGVEPTCVIEANPNDTYGLAFQFRITNWDTIVTNEYVRILFRHNVQNEVYQVYYIATQQLMMMNIYANMEAYNDGRNGHMNSRKLVNVQNFYFCGLQHQSYQTFKVTQFDHVGANTVMSVDATTTANWGFDLNNGNCSYQQCIEITMFGLQDYAMGSTIQMRWFINNGLNGCQGWVDYRSKGLHRWTLCFDQYSGCQYGGWYASQKLTFEVTFVNTLIPLDRNFWWVHMRYYQLNTWANVSWCRGSYEWACLDDEWVNEFQVGNSLSVTPLSRTVDSITEIDFTVYGIYEAIGLDVNVNRILIMEFNGADWPSNPIYNTQYELQEINCICGVNTSVLTPQICVRRIRKTVAGRLYDPVVLFYFSAPTGSNVRCSVPEIIVGSSLNPRNLKFKIIRPSLYEWYGAKGESFNSRVKTTWVFTPIPNASTSDLNIFYDPSVFYIDRTTTELFKGYYDLQVQNIRNIDSPYVYIRHAEIGPLMTTELCEDQGIWDINYTKIFNQHTKMLICKRKSSVTTNAVIGAGKNLYFESWKSQTTADYNYYVYVYKNEDLKQQKISAPIANALFQPIKTSSFLVDHFFYSYKQSSDQVMIALQIGLRGFLWRETRDGGRVEIYMLRTEVTGITQNCAARIEKEFNNVLWCYVDNRNANYWIIVVHNMFTEFQTNSYLNVYFSMKNPTGGSNRSITYTVKFYYNFISDSDYKVQLQDTVVQSDFEFIEYDQNHIRITNAMSRFYGFRPKIFKRLRYEQRYYAKVLSPKIWLERIDFITNEQCLESNIDCNYYLDVRVREYDVNIPQRYQEIEVRGRSWMGNGFAINQPNYRVYTQGAKLEFIISNRRSNSYIGLYKNQDNYHPNHMLVWDSAQDILTILKGEHQSNTKYQDFSTIGDYQTNELKLDYFYFTNQIHKQLTSFVIGMYIRSGSTVDYPRIYFELKFPILTVANIPGATHGNTIPCQISLVLESQNPNRIGSARCRVFDINTQSYKGLMVRIEEVNRFNAAQVLMFAFDDWLLPDSTNEYTPIDIEFNLYRAYTPTSISLEYNRYFLLLKEMILVDGMNPSIWNNVSISPIQLKAPNSYTYGAKNVEYNGNIINGWPQATTGYLDTWGLYNTPGQKMRLMYYHGFVGGDNTPDSLTYFDGFGQLTLLWFNRKTGSAYISAPKRDSASNSITFEIRNAVNPYPYQKSTWNADGKIDYQLFMGQYWNFGGDGFRQTNIGTMDLSLKAQWAQFLREFPTITIDTSLSHLTDVVPTYSYASGQTITMRFRITHSVTQAERVKRQLASIVFDFTQGIKQIKKCYIQSEGQNTNVYINRYADCVIGFKNSRYQLSLYNIAEWDDKKPYQMFVQMVTDSDTIIYQMSTYILNGEQEHYRQITVPMIQYSNTNYAFNSFRFTEGKYLSGYYELAQRKLYSNSVNPTTWRLRFRLVLDLSLQYAITTTFIDPMTNSDYIQIKLPPLLTNAYIQTDPTQWLMCYFVPEISVYDKLALPLYSKCKLDTSGNPYFYKLTAPRDILTSGKAYVVHITEKRIQNASFTLPLAPLRSEFIWSCYSPMGTSQPSYDTFITRITSRFMQAKINHLTTSSEDYDVAEITFIPSTSMMEITETYLLIEIDSIYFQQYGINYQDFDLINTYNRDGLPEFINGNDHSYLIEPAFSTGYSLVNFGQHSNFFANIQISHVYGQDFIAGQTYVFKIPMVKNPKDQHISLSYKISTVKINTRDMRKQVLDEYWFVNHAYVDTVHTDMTSSNFQMNSLNDYVQQTNMDINLRFNYNIAAPQRILLKWDNNNKIGIDRTQLMTITISGCKVEIFDKIYLIMITPQTYSSSAWSVMSLGTNFKSNSYSVQFGFWYTYITKNQLTQYYYNPTSSWLKPLEDLTPKTLNYKTGYQTINSVCLYRLTISTPAKVPIGGYIQINLSNELEGYEPQCYTYTTYYLVDSTNVAQVNYGPLECQMKDSKTYILKGFNNFNAVTSINVEFYLKNVNGGAVVNLQSVAMYGTQNPLNVIAISKPVPQVLILNSNAGMTFFQILDRVTYPVYAKEWKKLDFVFTQRSNDLMINQNFQLKLTLPPGWIRASGARLQLKGRYKMNDPPYAPYETYRSPAYKYMDYITPKYSQESDKLVFDINVDDPLLSHYSINKQVEYIFSIDSQRADIAYQEGLWNPDRGLYNFYLEAFQGPTLLERTYNEFYVKPREDVSDTFRVSVLNTAAGEKTAIRFTFTMNYNKAQIGDEIWIEFQTFDRLNKVFKNDLGLGITDISGPIGCSEKVGFNKISSSRILCYLFKGDQNILSPKRGTQARIKIAISKDIATTEQIDFWVAYVENPLIVGQIAGIKLSIRRDCRDDSPHFQCILYHAEHQYKVTKSIPLSTYLTKGAFKANPNTVTLAATHTFVLNPTANILNNQYILIQYPSNHKNQNTCTTLVGECIEFPEYNWVLFKPSATLRSGLDNSIDLNNMINGWHRRNPSPDNYFVVQVFDNSGNIVQPFKITHNYYDHYMINTNGQIINTQTYDPQYHITTVFLKEGYVNVAQIDVINMDIESEINYFRLEKPKEISSFDMNYCNATLSLMPTTNRIPYPLRYDCEIFNQYILLTRTKYFLPWDTTYTSFNLRIYFKFTIDNTIPPTNGILPGPASPFILYGCVLRCDDSTNPTNIVEYSHVTKSVIPWDVSFYQQPNLNTAGFYTESYSQREAHINEKVSLQMLIQPNTKSSTCNIDKFVFTVPDEFIYPSALSLDRCSIQGTKSVTVDSCTLSRRQGQTQITLKISEILGDLAKIITISDQDGNELFVAPPYPGTFYPIKLEMFCGSQLVETQYTNFTNVKGENLDVNYVKVINSLDQLTPQLYEFQLKTGKYVTPIGYQRSVQGTLSDSVYSQINLIFEWVGDGYTIHPGYASDLGMGIQDGSEVGCAVKSGLTILTGQRLKCILNYGSGPEKMPMIQISNYESIAANTLISILITNIQSIAINLQTTVKLGIQITNPTLKQSAYFYNLVAYVPDLTTVLNNPLVSTTNTVTVSGNNQIHSTSNYQFTFTLGTRILKTTDYFGVAFPDNFINTQMYNPSTVSCSSTCSAIYVFPASSMIYIRPNANKAAGSSVTFTISGIPNPNYAIQGSLTINQFTFIDRKIDAYYKAQFTANFVPSSVFTSANVDVSSQTGGEAKVTYTFSFILGHTVPPNGAISIDFPNGMYDNPSSMATPLKCKIKGDVFDSDQFNKSTCSFSSSNRISIYLSNTQLLPTVQYSLTVEGITNPNVNANQILQQNFIFSSHFNNNVMLNQIIAQKVVSPPVFYLTAIKKCSIQVSPQIKNVNLKSFYQFKFLCKTVIKDKTTIQIALPVEYKVQFNQGTFSCSSDEPATLYTKQCDFSTLKGDFVLSATLREIPFQSTFTINVILQNPAIASNSYRFSAKFISYSQQYAETDNSEQFFASIFDNTNIIYAKNEASKQQIKLQNVPINAAEPAFYIFKIPAARKVTPIQETIIQFPNHFDRNLGDNLKCFIYNTNNDSYRFSIHDILKLRAKKMGQDSQNFISVPCSNNIDYTITLSKVNEIYNQTALAWNYLLVQNVYNPGKFYLDQYRIVHTHENVAKWIFEDNLYYEITDSAKQLDIKKISPKVNSTTVQTPYTFETYSIQSLRKNILAGIMIDLPDQFDLSLQPTQINCYSSISREFKTDCQLYNNTILSWKQITTYQDIFHYLYVDSLVNPTTTDACSNSNIENPFYKISIIDLTSNEIIAVSKPDRSLCVNYVSDLMYIKVEGPSKLVRGFSYDFNIEIEKPANTLKLIPLYNDLHFELIPNTFVFKDYDFPSTIKFKVLVKSRASLGENTIKFSKIETREGYYEKAGDQYQQPPILTFDVIEQGTDTSTKYVTVEDFKAFSVGGQVTAFVNIPEPPSQNMYLNIDTTSSKSVNVNPSRLLINSSTKQVQFTVEYTDTKIVEPIPFYFSLSSNYKIVHKMNPLVKHLVVTQSKSHKDNNIAKLDFMNTKPMESHYKNDLGKPVNQALISADVLKPEILSIKAIQITETKIVLNVVTSQPAMVKYLVTFKNSKPPLLSNEVYAYTYSEGEIVNKGKSHSQSFYPEAKDHTTEITIEDLSFSTSYDFYAICHNGLGTSDIKNFNFTTSYLKSGSIIHITLRNSTDSQTLINQLSYALRIKKSDMALLTSQKIISDQGKRENNTLFSYEIAIAPLASGFDINNYLNDITTNNSESFKNLLSSFVTGFENFRVEPFSRKYMNGLTKMTKIEPKVESVEFYSAVISIRAWEDSLIYGIVLEDDVPLTTQPISQQVILGLNQYNKKVNEFWSAKSQTNSSNHHIANLHFDNLKDGVSYRAYLTATNVMPYPEQLKYLRLADDQVISFNFTTPFNFNIDRCMMLEELKTVNHKLSLLFEQRFETDREAGYCKRVKSHKFNFTKGY